MKLFAFFGKKTNNPASFDLEIQTGADVFGHFIEVPLLTAKDRAHQGELSTFATKLQMERPRSFEIKTTHTYKGPNIHAQHPAVKIDVNVWNFNSTASRTVARTVPELTRFLPELATAVTNKADKIETHLAELSAITTLALMQRVDERISSVGSRLLESIPGFYLVCEYKRSPDNAKAAAKLALELLDPTTNEEMLKRSLVDFEREGTRRVKIPFHAANIIEAAEARGIPVSRAVAGSPIMGLGSLQVRLSQTMTSKSGYLAVRLAQDKVKTANILRQAGLPAPQQQVVTNQTDAIAAAERIGYPVVVKPARGNMGRGVSVRLTSRSAIATAFKEAAAIDNNVIVESYIAGSSYRLLVVDGEMVAASQYIAGHVIGNGRDTVGRLLDALNADPRRDNHFLYKIKLDFDARRMLKEQRLTLESIPENGQTVFLRSNSNPNVGALCIGLTEHVHPDNRLLAIAAARALQLDVAGIDMITEDISRSYKESRGAICEVNNMPGLGAHATPTSGSVVDVAPYILDMLFPPPSTGRIPIIAIGGDHFEDRLSYSIAHLLQVVGYEVGLATHEGLWIGGDLISRKDSANHEGAKQVLLHPCATAAVFEVSTKSILTDGLGFDSADVVLIANCSSNRQVNKEHAAALTTLIQSSLSALILDDSAVRLHNILTTLGKKKIYTTSNPSTLLNWKDIIKIDDIRVGAETLAQKRLPRLSIAACHAIGISPEIIEDALRAYVDVSRTDPLLIRGLVTSFGRILIATPRNSADVTLITELAKSWAAPQLPDTIVHMSFRGDALLQAALTARLQTGEARQLDAAGITDSTSLSSLVFKGAKKRVVILTDNYEYFRKRLGHSDAPISVAPRASLAGSRVYP